MYDFGSIKVHDAISLLQKKLHALTIESDRLKGETTSRVDLLSRIDAETRMVEEERAKAEHINRKYRQQLSDYKVHFLLLCHVQVASCQNISQMSSLYHIYPTRTASMCCIMYR